MLNRERRLKERITGKFRMMVGNSNNSNGEFSTSLQRGLAILAAFSPERSLLGISELATQLGMNRSTVHRYVSTLEALRYVAQDRVTRKYRLGLRVLDL